MNTKSADEIAPGIYWVGVEDWNRKYFDALIPLPLGTSYNSYLVVGREKVALVDTVHRAFHEEFLQKIGRIVKPERIDYIVMNHAEPDHAGSIPTVLEIAKNAKLITTRMGVEMARIFHNVTSERTIMMKDGDTLDLGGKTLKFVEAPWLHWPETMFTYCVEQGVLFPCDFFGAHMAKKKLFDDEQGENLISDAKKYYAEIMMPFPIAIQRALDKIKIIDVKMIAPSHGPIYRNPKRVLDAYEKWARGPLEPRVIMIYVTMWGATEALEKAIAEGITSKGVEVVPYDLLTSDLSHVMRDIVDASAIIIGAPTVLNNAHPLAITAVELIRELKPRAKLVAAFGSYGWGRAATKVIADRLQQSGFEVVETLEVRGPPKKEDLEKAVNLGKHVADRALESLKV